MEGMLQEVLRFLPSHCRLLTEVVAGDLGEGLRARPLEGYDFVVHSVWPEVAAVLEKRVPAVFAAGNPETFHKVGRTRRGLMRMTHYLVEAELCCTPPLPSPHLTAELFHSFCLLVLV